MKTERITQQFPEAKWDAGAQFFVVPHAALLDVVNFLKNDPEKFKELMENRKEKIPVFH